MNFAGVRKLPVVFVVNNNQWAISVPRLQTASETLAQKAIAAGFRRSGRRQRRDCRARRGRRRDCRARSGKGPRDRGHHLSPGRPHDRR